jgi:hypothetical protein
LQAIATPALENADIDGVISVTDNDSLAGDHSNLCPRLPSNILCVERDYPRSREIQTDKENWRLLQAAKKQPGVVASDGCCI